MTLHHIPAQDPEVAAAIDADQVVVVRSLIELEDRLAGLEEVGR